MRCQDKMCDWWNRFLLRRLRILLMEYLILMRSVEIYLSEKFHCKGVNDLREFIWADYKKRLWDDNFLSDLLKIQINKYEIYILEFRKYRQMIMIFMKKYLKYKVTDMMLSLDVILNRQVSHSSRIISISYIIIS